MYVCMYKWQGIEVVGGQETGDEVAWAPLYDEQFKIWSDPPPQICMGVGGGGGWVAGVASPLWSYGICTFFRRLRAGDIFFLILFALILLVPAANVVSGRCAEHVFGVVSLVRLGVPEGC